MDSSHYCTGEISRPFLPLGLCNIWNVQCMCLLLKHRLVFPTIFFEEVFWPDGRSLTQSLFSFCFRGEGAASPLNSRGRRLGDALIHAHTNRYIVLLAVQVLCSSVHTPGSCKILQEYRDIFNSPYCTQYSFI